MIEFVPLGTFLIVSPDDVYEPSPILRPETVAEERPQSGWVTGVGPGVDPEYMGRHLVFDGQQSYEYTVKGEGKRIVIDVGTVLGFLEGPDAAA